VTFLRPRPLLAECDSRVTQIEWVLRDTYNFERALTEVTVIVPKFSKAKVCKLSWVKKPLTTLWLAVDKFVYNSCVIDPDTHLVDPSSFNLWTGYQISEQRAHEWKERNGLSDMDILGMVRHYLRHFMLVIGNSVFVSVHDCLSR
jgi:hypothetical protein